LSGLDPEKRHPEGTHPEKTWDRPIAGSAIDVSLIVAPLTSAVMPRHRVSAFGEPDDRLPRGVPVFRDIRGNRGAGVYLTVPLSRRRRRQIL
jgi:hypothetical protein